MRSVAAAWGNHCLDLWMDDVHGASVQIPFLELDERNVLMGDSPHLACTSGHLDARSRSNVEFLAISLAVEGQASSAVGATPQRGVCVGVCGHEASPYNERAGQMGKTSR
jgi:hypothetical protein